MDAQAEGRASNVTVSAVIIRACSVCGMARQRDTDCATCGNTEPAQVHDLGVQAAHYSDPLKQLTWQLFGKHAAANRARQANREKIDGDHS